MTMRIMMTDAGMGISPYTELALPVSSKRDHCLGPDNALVTLLEYGDYECPYCGRAYVMIKRIQDYFGDQLRFAYRNFPLTQIHPHAQNAAEAAEAAGVQGRYWEMHDMLYENQTALDDPSLREYALVLELDMERFDDEMMRHVHAPRVREDFMSGVRSGVNGTPTFYVNGIRYDGSWGGDELMTAIEELIEGNARRSTKRRRRR
jgi:protein-disulfide isomerase